MHFKATIRRTARKSSSAGTMLATFLLVGAGVAAIAQPLERPRMLGALTLAEPTLAAPVVRPATVRIVLPAPTPERHLPTGKLHIALDDLSPAPSAAPEPVALAAAIPEKAAPLSMAPTRISPRVPISPAEAEKKLAAAE